EERGRHRSRMARLLALLASLLASAALAQPRPSTHWPKTLTLATCSLGASYVVYWDTWADLVNAKLGTHIAIQQTDGPVQNVTLTDGRLTDFGMTTMGVAIQAWQGGGGGARGRPPR